MIIGSASSSKITAATYFGSGNVLKINQQAMLLGKEVEGVLVNANLSAIQERNLARQIGLPVKDRVGLILGIFADRAQTREARLQVGFHFSCPAGCLKLHMLGRGSRSTISLQDGVLWIEVETLSSIPTKMSTPTIFSSFGLHGLSSNLLEIVRVILFIGLEDGVFCKHFNKQSIRGILLNAVSLLPRLFTKEGMPMKAFEPSRLGSSNGSNNAGQVSAVAPNVPPNAICIARHI